MRLSQKAIDAVFETASAEEKPHQARVLEALYKLVIPQWDAAERIEGYPVCGKVAWKYICKRFMDFDREHHPGVFAGGAWMNVGFSSDDGLGDWEVSTREIKVRLRAPALAVA